MRTAKRVLAIVMVLTMLCVFFVLPASAAEAATIKLTATQTASSPDIYKVTVSTQCNMTLQNMNMILLFDKTAFKLIRNTGVANTSATNANGYLKEGEMTDNQIYDGSIEHPVYGTDVDAFHPDYGYAKGVGSGSFTFQVKPAAAAYGTLSQDTWQAMLFDWTANLDDNALMFNCASEKPVFSFYLQKLDTAADGAYEVGIIDGCKVPVVVYDTSNAVDTMASADGAKATISVQNATITLGSAAAAPVLSTAGRQVKMDVADGAVVKGSEQLRVVSSISNDDWNNYFANTTDEAATTDKLVEVGIVASKGAFNMDDAKAAAQQGKGTHGDYTVATTTYIQNTGSDYRFGARIEYNSDVFDTTYVAFAKYLDAEGAEAYVFYDASYALAFATDYSTITASYIAFLNGQA